MGEIVERARARLKHIKDDGDAVLIDMLVTYIERLEAECTPRWMQIAHEQQEEIERLREALRDVIRDVDGYNALLTEKDRDGLTWVSVKRAREALGDD